MSRTDLNNKDGVYFIDHLHELVMDHVKPCSVVLRTDDQSFIDVPIKAWWIRYKDSLRTSEFFFDVPDEIWRRIQSNYVTRIYREIYGLDIVSNLPQAFRETHDAERWKRNNDHDDERYVVEVIENDWSALRRAIEATASDSGNRYEGHRIELIDSQRHGNGRARIKDNRLEIHMRPVLVRSIIMDWKKAANDGIPLPEAW